jgi:hypothetical protein
MSKSPVFDNRRGNSAKNQRKVLNVKRIYLRLSFVAAFALSGGAVAQNHQHNRYSFACNSRHLMLEDFEKEPTIDSPDKVKVVQLTKDYKFRVAVAVKEVSNFELPDISSNVEVGWSPDSSQFFISYSDGGAVGGYHARLYRVTDTDVNMGRVPALVAERFRGKHRCKSRGSNLFFLDWTPDSKIGFFVAEVYPTGDCGKELGAFRGYAVNLEDGTPVRAFGKKQTESIEKNCRLSGSLVLPTK